MLGCVHHRQPHHDLTEVIPDETEREVKHEKREENHCISQFYEDLLFLRLIITVKIFCFFNLRHGFGINKRPDRGTQANCTCSVHQNSDCYCNVQKSWQSERCTVVHLGFWMVVDELCGQWCEQGGEADTVWFQEWHRVMKEFDCRTVSTLSCGAEQRERVGLHGSAASKLDDVLGSRAVSCSTFVLTRYKSCRTWDHYPVYAVVVEGVGGRDKRECMDGVVAER